MMRSLSAAALLLAGHAAAQVRITSAASSGPLCPPNTWAATIVDTADALAISFDAFHIQADAGIATTRGPCTILIGLAYPPGCTRATFGAYMRGFLPGDPPATATVNEKFRWDGREYGYLDTAVSGGGGAGSPDVVWHGETEIDGSLGVDAAEGGAEVELEVVLSLGFSVSKDGVGRFDSEFIFETFNLNITDVVADSDWENCNL